MFYTQPSSPQTISNDDSTPQDSDESTQTNLPEVNMEAYQSAMEHIQKRADPKSHFYREIEAYFNMKHVISCLYKAEHHNIYGKNIRILVELLHFISRRKEQAPVLLNKILKLKNLYGEDLYKFKELMNLMSISEDGNQLIDMYSQLGPPEQAKKTANKAKTAIGNTINVLAKDVTREDRKNKKRGRGLTNFDTAPYEEEILKVISEYLGVENLPKKDLLKLMDSLLNPERHDSSLVKDIIGRVKEKVQQVQPPL